MWKVEFLATRETSFMSSIPMISCFGLRSGSGLGGVVLSVGLGLGLGNGNDLMLGSKVSEV